MSNLVGIHLGITFSAIARFAEEGRPVLIQNRDGNNKMPSVVCFASGEQVHIGEAARKSLWEDPNTFGRFKRHMGESKEYEAYGQIHTPTTLSSFVLKKLKDEAESQIGKIDEVVLTIPADFANEAREATMEAAKLAGLNVKHIINEPTAAALYYAHQSLESLEGVYAVYTLGGCTFDISIVRIQGSDIELLASEGVKKLGGDDFDETLVTLVKNKYELETNGTHEEGYFTKNDAEAEKKTLSSTDDVTIRIRSEGGQAMLTLTRSEFEEAISSYVVQAEMQCEIAMDNADVTTDSIKGVFLAGGSTRIPCIQESVKRIFKQTPILIHAWGVDEILALGASIYAACKADGSILTDNQRQSIADYTMQDVAPSCFGIARLNDEGKLVNDVWIMRNTIIPCSVTKILNITYTGQEYYRICITQSELPETELEFVTQDLCIPLLPSEPGKELQIEVKMSYDENGIVHVSARDIETDFCSQLDLITANTHRNNLKDEGFTIEDLPIEDETKPNSTLKDIEKFMVE